MPDVLCILLRYTIPTSDGIPWVIKERKDVGKVRPLLTKMKDSRVMKLHEASSASKVVQSIRGEKPATKRKDEPKPKVKAKGKAKVKAKAKAKPNEGTVEPMHAQIVEKGGVRDTLFIDDIINAIDWALENVTERDQKKVNKAFLICIEYALRGQIQLADLKEQPCNFYTVHVYMSDVCDKCNRT